MPNRKLNFYIPDFYRFYNLNLLLIKMLREHPEWFYDGVNIHSVYGAFPGALWNGGRYIGGDKIDFASASAIIDAFNELGVAIRFTWTNGAVPPEVESDFYCNMLTSLAAERDNEILVNQPWLETYLRENFRGFSYISSITKPVPGLKELLELYDRDYFLIVPPRSFLFDKEKLFQLPKDRTELLINSFCALNCPNFFDHHYQTSLQIAGLPYEKLPCNSMGYTFYEQISHKQSLSLDELYSFYVTQGFSHFKIEGRSYHPIEMAEVYVYYLVRPEYRLIARQQLLRLVIDDKVSWKNT